MPADERLLIDARKVLVGDHPETCTVRMPVTSPLPAALVFHQQGTGEVGRLEYGPPMRFDGDAEESARVFFKYICQLWNERERL